MAASFTVRAIGPRVSWLGVAGIMPNRLTNGRVGRKPTRLLKAAGPRTDPPVSSAIPTAAKLAAMPAPVPLEEPDGLRAGLYGFRAIPKAEPMYPAANSPIFVFARMIAPAFFIFVVIVASRRGANSWKITDP